MKKTIVNFLCILSINFSIYANGIIDYKNHVKISATRLCKEEDNNINLNILQIVLQSDSGFIIVPDDSAKIWFIFVSEKGDTVNKHLPLYLKYSLEYSLGGYGLPSSPCNYDQLKEDNRETYFVPYLVKKDGIYYKFHKTIPTKKEWRVSQIIVHISIRVKSQNNEYNTINELTDIIYIK